MRRVKYLMLAALVASIAASTALGGSSVPTKQAQANATKVYVVASKSFCVPTGISDIYTGNGKVTFYMTLRNVGYRSEKVDITPVRHYDDGSINESAMDILIDVKVPARSVKRYRSPAYTYEAHNHEVEACGLRINNGREVRIKVIHL